MNQRKEQARHHDAHRGTRRPRQARQQKSPKHHFLPDRRRQPQHQEPKQLDVHPVPVKHADRRRRRRRRVMELTPAREQRDHGPVQPVNRRKQRHAEPDSDPRHPRRALGAHGEKLPIRVRPQRPLEEHRDDDHLARVQQQVPDRSLPRVGKRHVLRRQHRRLQERQHRRYHLVRRDPERDDPRDHHQGHRVQFPWRLWGGGVERRKYEDEQVREPERLGLGCGRELVP